MRHLLVGERVVRLDRGVARCGRRNALQRILHLGAPVQALEVLRQREQRFRAIFDLEERRYGGDLDRGAAEAFELEAESLELGRSVDQRLTRSKSTRSWATCWSMIARPSSSTAMMKVSRN
jgi:hypothetical protein